MVTVPEHAWAEAQKLLYDANGKQNEEVLSVKSGWMRPFEVKFFAKEDELAFVSLLAEKNIDVKQWED